LGCFQSEEAEEVSAGADQDLRVFRSQEAQGAVVQRAADPQVRQVLVHALCVSTRAHSAS